MTKKIYAEVNHDNGTFFVTKVINTVDYACPGDTLQLDQMAELCEMAHRNEDGLEVILE